MMTIGATTLVTTSDSISTTRSQTKKRKAMTPSPQRPPRVLRTVSAGEKQRQDDVPLPSPALMRFAKPPLFRPLTTSETPPSHPRITLDITATAINKHVKFLFPDPVVQNQPHCLSARIFAAFALTAQQTELQQCTPQRSTRHGHTSKHLSPILPLMRALVLVEAVSLASNTTATTSSSSSNTPRRTTGSATKTTASNKKKPKHLRPRIHFSGFDCSAVHPPVDRVGGSDVHQQDSIQALLAAKEEVDELVRTHSIYSSAWNNNRAVVDNDENQVAGGAATNASTPVTCLQSLVEFLGPALPGGAATATNTSTAVTCLEALVEFLGTLQQEQTMEKPKDDVETDDAVTSQVAPVSAAASWWRECALALPGNYPARRVAKAVDQYRQDFSIILDRLQGRNNNDLDHENSLLVERCLSLLVGQAIRYHLRRFFNRAPPRLTPADTQYEQREQQYSRVKELIVMTMPDDLSNTAVEDECISALVSLALCRMYEFFGLEALLSPQPPHADMLPHSFCTHPVTHRGFSIRGPPTTLSKKDLDEVLHDMDHAAGFLAAYSACQFLLGLFSAAGVQKEIKRQGGWSQLETYASISWKHDLWKLCPDDAHLVALCNYQALHQRLQLYQIAMEPARTTCLESLEAVQQRFHCKTKTKNVYTKFPQIPVLAAAYNEGMARAHAFPVVRAASEM